MDPSTFLTGANMAAVGVTFAIVQMLKFFLPSPAPANVNTPGDRWSVVKRWTWVPFVAAFFIGGGVAHLMMFLSNHPTNWKNVVNTGLQTGAFAVVTWEAYDQVVSRIIDRLKGS